MRIVIATTDSDWSAPLAALLRERGFDTAEVPGVLEAMALLDEPTVGLVANADIGSDEALLALKTVSRRFPDRIQCVGVGVVEGGASPGTAWCENPYQYVRLVETLTADLADPNAVTRPAPLSEDDEGREPFAIGTLGEVSRLLHTARFDPYFRLLRVDRDATNSEVKLAASALRDALDEDAVPAHVVDACYEELAEVRAAVDDAEAVLTSGAARMAYLRALV